MRGVRYHARVLRCLVGLAFVGLALGACGEGEDRPTSWSYVSATIVQPNCATSSCHSKHSAVAGLRLDSREGGYVQLVGGTTADGQNLVVPGQPHESQLVYQLRGIERRRMPPDNPLPEADIELIEQWIADGARND